MRLLFLLSLLLVGFASAAAMAEEALSPAERLQRAIEAAAAGGITVGLR